jgi:uncharacterized protein
MRKILSIFVIFSSFFVVFINCTYLQAQVDKLQKDFSPVVLSNTETRSIKSSFIDQEYNLQIYIPPSYADTLKYFPVLYLLDSDKSFGMAKDIIEWLMLNKEIPDIIIVGISYGEGAKAWWNKRSRDYTPSLDRAKAWGDWPLAGGADNFKKFIHIELFPFINGNYRVLSNDRTIAGLSFGGLFATYVLFTEPELFNRYIISGPTLIWDDKIIFRYENDFAQNHNTLKATVYSSVGKLDDHDKIINPWKEFVEIVENRNYKGLKITNEIIDGETHLSVWPTSFTKGLKYVYSEK